MQGRPVSIVTADDGKRKAAFFRPYKGQGGRGEGDPSKDSIALPLYIITACVRSSTYRDNLGFAFAKTQVFFFFSFFANLIFKNHLIGPRGCAMGVYRV